jgi:hypothetical protein
VTGSLRADVLRDRASEFLLVAFVIGAGAAAGLAGVRSPKLGALAVASVVVLMVVSRRPVFLAVLAVVGVYGAQRLGSASSTPGTAGGISYSDALVAAAAIMALPALAGTPELRRLRGAAGAIAIYLALLIPSVIATPSMKTGLEWLHRLVMIGGALLVGAWLVREHVERTALLLLTAFSAVMATAAIANCLSHGLQPGAPFGLNKNFIGSLFAAVVIVLLAAGPVVHVAPWMRTLAVLLVGGGLIACQSRGAELGAVLGVLVAFVLDLGSHGMRARISAMVVAAALAIVAVISIRHQLSLSKPDLNNSSVGVRVNVEQVTRRIWHTSLFVGVGLKYFLTGNFGPYAYAPNNVIDNELAESGLIGLTGFVLFQFGVIWAGIRRRTSPLSAAAVGTVAGQLLHGMVDIYWAAGVVTLPFLLLGIALAGPRPSALRSGARRRTPVGSHRAG